MKRKQLYPDLNMPDTFLRQSRAAASYDAVVALAVALDEVMLDVNRTEMFSDALNTTLSNIKLNGLAVSGTLIILAILTSIYSLLQKFHHFNRSQDFRFNVLVSQFIGNAQNV